MSYPIHRIYQYRLTYPTGRWLADVILRSDGFFAIVSDYGNYAFRWTHPGMEFRAFVAGLVGQDDYVCSKLSSHNWWDGEATFKAIKERICYLRREGGWSKEQAKEAWASLSGALHFGLLSRRLRGVSEIDQHEFHRFYESTNVPDAAELARYDYPPDVRGFCENVMPVLATAIHAELAQEATCDLG